MSGTGVFGKLLPNLKVTIGDDELSNSENSLEAGEIIEEKNEQKDAEIPKIEFVRKWMKTLHNPRVYPTNLGGFQTGLDLSSEVLVKKLEKRAERFGLDEKNRSQITQLEINELYKSFGLDPDNLSNSKNIRLGVIHMRGVNDMNTKEVSEYFKDFGPSSVEWINDTSCNVCWFDETSAARALLSMSHDFLIKRPGKQEIKADFESKSLNKEEETADMSGSEEEENPVRKESSENSDGEVEMDVDKTLDEEMDDDIKNLPIDIPVPPGHWRLGLPHPKTKAILLRFATLDDKKLRGAEKRSQYYQKYGNPNYGGLRGLISNSRKRKFQNQRNRQIVEDFSGDLETKAENHDYHYSSDSQKRAKVPRMKMYADEEEEKKRSKHIRLERDNRNTKSIKSRLGPRYTRDDLLRIGPKTSDTDDDDESLEGETLSVTCKIPSRFNIWSDQAKLMAQEDEELEEKRLMKSRGSTRYSAHTSERDGFVRDRRNDDDYDVDLREAIRTSSLRKNAPETDLRSRIGKLKEEKSHRLGSRIGKLKEDKPHRLGSRIGKLKEDKPRRLGSRIGELKEDNPKKYRSPLLRDSD